MNIFSQVSVVAILALGACTDAASIKTPPVEVGLKNASVNQQRILGVTEPIVRTFIREEEESTQQGFSGASDVTVNNSKKLKSSVHYVRSIPVNSALALQRLPLCVSQSLRASQRNCVLIAKRAT